MGRGLPKPHLCKKNCVAKKIAMQKKCIWVVPGFRSGPPQTTPLQKKLRCKKSCNAKKNAFGSSLDSARGLPKPHLCKKNCVAKKTVMQKKLQCKQMHLGRRWIPLGASPNHTSAKKTALQKKM